MLARLSVLSAAILLALSPTARADGVPDMTGKWTGTVDGAVMAGSTPDRAAEAGKKITFSNEPIDFTFNISEQQGTRFGGEMSNAKRSETLIGQIYPGNASGMMLDDDGHYVFNLSDANTMQVCYDHTKPDSKVITCWTATRTK